MNKDEILDALEDSREATLELLDEVPEQEWEKAGVMGDWSVKDILYHLTMWEAELVKMLWQINQGEPPSTALQDNIPEDERNAQWKIQAQTRTIDQVLSDFEGVRKQTSRRLQSIPEKAFEDEKYYPWLQGRPLWKWIADSSFQHETEHTLAVKQWVEKKT